MVGVNVLIDLPTRNLDRGYTYLVPDEFRDTACFGKRVLVELGSRKVEGYVVEDNVECKADLAKPVLKVLDPEPIFDQHLLSLAEWMADHYLCPLSTVLKAMIPGVLHHIKPEIVIPLLSLDQLQRTDGYLAAKYGRFFAALWEAKELSIQEARTYVNQDVLKQLEKLNLIKIVGTYSGARETRSGYYYTIKDFNPEEDMPVLLKKAPRQAEAMQILLEHNLAEASLLEKRVPRSSLKSLVGKGFIALERSINSGPVVRHKLNDEQQLAVDAIAKGLKYSRTKEFLLFGVTGSGKTEVYLTAAEKAISLGKTVLLLVPEIALTRHLVNVFTARIPRMAVMHSGMTRAERYREWEQAKKGAVDLVLGTRSAVFAPLPRLGLIIVDEEQENTFKQEETPRYHAREVARKRAELQEAVLVLGSATPSMETFHQAMEGGITNLKLSKRAGGSKMPEFYLEDMRKVFKKGIRNVISPMLQEKISSVLQRQEQCILFINRRGYSPVTVCRMCGHIESCPDCSVSLTYHRDIDRNVCHYCNYQSKVSIKCSKCGSRYLQQAGIGTQRVEEEIRRQFPAACIERLDMDTSRKKGMQKNILERMKKREIDILIGTQMVAKGLDFPGVSLVGIVDADGMLNLPDFRAGERAYQLIVQASGRAGRRNIPGEVVIQTYNPDSMVIQMAARNDFLGFYQEEIRMRRLLNYPPFTHVLRVVALSGHESEAKFLAGMVASYTKEITDAKEDELFILGPAPCPIEKIRNKFRYQVMVKCDNMLLLKSIGQNILDNIVNKNAKLEVDIDPLITM